MNREEALNKAIGILTYNQVNFCKSKEAVASMNEIIEALEKIDQECVADNDTNVTATDAVSRQRVAEVLLKYAHSTEGKAFAEFLVSQINDLPSITPQPKMGRCKDCKYFEYDSVIKVNGLPLHEICSRWGDGCKTSEDGYCFLFEPKTQEVEE